MASIGFDTYRFQLVAYVVSGGSAGWPISRQPHRFRIARSCRGSAPAIPHHESSAAWGGATRGDGVPHARGAAADYTEHWKVIFGPLLVVVCSGAAA
jgi:hypothetical protein